MAAGKAPNSVITEIFDEGWIGFADSLFKDVAQGGHRYL
jgi:hypothetical protein